MRFQVILVLLTVTFSDSIALTALQNLAFGKVCSLSIAPDARTCTDPDDIKQLTDGFYSSGNFWTQRSTVGWQRGNPLVIKLDLGRIEPLGGASFSSATGSGRSFPSAVYVLASDDGKTFREAGELIALGPERSWPSATNSGAHKFSTDKLKAHGRYVMFVVFSGSAIYTDEIEVYRGNPELMSLPPSGNLVTNESAFISERLVSTAVARRLRSDAHTLRAIVANATVSPEVEKEIAAALSQTEFKIPDLPQKHDPGYRAIIPLNGLHAEIFRAQAMLWRGQGAPAISVWQSGLWDPLVPMHAYAPGAVPMLQVALMQNEFRATSFNLSNSGQQEEEITVNITGMPGGKNPPCITVHEVLWTDTRSGQPIASALPTAKKQKSGYVINVHPGLARQVWLTFHSAGIRPGTYAGRILISGRNSKQSLPLTLRVYPLQMPDKMDLHIGGWDYTDTEDHLDVTPANRSALIRHLREHFVDSPWATASVMPFASYDSQGFQLVAPDTGKFDEWLRRWPQATRYCVFANVGNECAGAKIGEPEFVNRVADWVSFWAAHAQTRGIQPSQLALLLVDEPADPAKDAIILAWAKAMRAARTDIKVWEDPIHVDPFAANREMLEVCDVLCPNRAKMVADPKVRSFYTSHRPKEPELAFYSCSGPAKLLDPYTYFRLQAWDAWRSGAKSSYFWAFSDSGGCSSWNEYVVRIANYSPDFIDETTITPGKHMEAIRESAEDYQYLQLLRKAVDAAVSRGKTGSPVEKAQRLLSEAASRVCDAPGASGLVWSTPKDRSMADRVRIEILDALLVLSN